jgi:hypothetical protein
MPARPPTTIGPFAADTAILDELARTRWGATAFCCPRCKHDRCWKIRTRPRVRQCSKCRYITSVTSGTLLQGTRLPLEVWVRRGEIFETCARIPTCRELSLDYGMACSTAWLLNQKMFVLAEACSRPLIPGSRFFLARIRVRRPRPTSRMHEAAPRHLQILHAHHREGRVQNVAVWASLHLRDETVWVDRVGLSDEELTQRQLSPMDWMQRHDLASLPRWLRAMLELFRHTVSLRWLPRWLHAMLVLWRSDKPEMNPPRWDLAAIAIGACPLRTLDPWGQPAAA